MIDAKILTLGSRFSSDLVHRVCGDGIRHFAFGTLSKLANGKLLATWRNGSRHAVTDGKIEVSVSTDSAGHVWPSSATVVEDYTGGTAYQDPCATVLANGNVLLTYFTSDALTTYVRKSTDNCATWSARTRIHDAAFDLLEANSAPMCEAFGKLFLPMYVQSTGRANWDAYVYEINPTTFAIVAKHKVADGVTFGNDWAEPGLVLLQDGRLMCLLRNETLATMYQSFSTDGATWTTPATTGMTAKSAARFTQLASGRIVALLRPNNLQSSNLYWTDDLGTTWNNAPFTMGVDATPGTCDYGSILEITSGVMTVYYFPEQYVGGVPLLSYASGYVREIPEWALDGHMPTALVPSSLACAGGATQQFEARGPGNVTWSLPDNHSGATLVSGFYTAGPSTGSDTVRATDLNGFHVDAVVSVTGSAFSPWLLSSCLFWFDTVNSTITKSGGNLVSIEDKGPGAHTVVPNGAPVVPVTDSDPAAGDIPTLTTGTGFLKTNSAIGLSRFTQFAGLITSATGYISVHNTDGGDGSFWYTSGPSWFVQRTSSFQYENSSAFVVAVTAGVPVVAEAFFDGTADDIDLRIGGVSMGRDSVGGGDLDSSTVTGVLYIGGSQSGGSVLAAKFYAYGIFDPTISAGEKAQVRAFIAALTA